MDQNSKTQHKIFAFIKIGMETHLKALCEYGQVYLSPIQKFREFEDGDLRGDSYEGTNQITNSYPGTFMIPEIDHIVNYESVHIKEAFERLNGHVYSLYCISSHGFPNPYAFSFDDRIKRFGDHFAILDPGTFINRMETALSKRNLKFVHGFVEYYDKSNYTGKLSIFNKPKEFEYQKEFRFYVETNTNEPIILTIGGLQQNAHIFPIDYLDGIFLQSLE